MSADPSVGFFGKMPQLGDFVVRRIHPAFRTCWDEWLQDGIVASQSTLGAGWLDVYLTSPVWRFAISRGVCGEAVYAGVMVPSVDRVGRYFPLSIIATLPPDTACVPLLTGARDWFDAAERVLLDVLESQIADADELDRLVADTSGPLGALGALVRPAVRLERVGNLAVQLPKLDGLSQQLLALMDPFLGAQFSHPTYWLTEGSVRVSPTLLVVQGLPIPATYASMLGGAFDSASWQVVLPPPEAHDARSPAVALFSSTRTDRGHAREQNEDYAVSRPDVGLWVLADGMGGYRDGALASATICEALEAASWSGTLTDRVRIATRVLHELNATLRRNSEQAGQDIRSAATVVVLLAQGDRLACLWSGDSRLYRVRAGALQQLTRDHSVGDRSAGSGSGGEYFVTAGVGVAEQLQVDSIYSDLRVGDRLLLCSDGVHEAVADAVLIDALAEAAPAASTHELMRAVLAGPARDNATATVIFAMDA
jgi:type VI secretion system protein ImpM